MLVGNVGSDRNKTLTDSVHRSRNSNSLCQCSPGYLVEDAVQVVIRGEHDQHGAIYFVSFVEVSREFNLRCTVQVAVECPFIFRVVIPLMLIYSNI